MPVGIGLQNGPDRGVELGIHQHDVLAVLECLEHDVGAELDRAGDIDEHVDDVGERARSIASSVATGLRARRSIVEFALRLSDDNVLAARVVEHVDGSLRTAGWISRPRACPGVLLT